MGHTLRYESGVAGSGTQYYRKVVFGVLRFGTSVTGFIAERVTHCTFQ